MEFLTQEAAQKICFEYLKFGYISASNISKTSVVPVSGVEADIAGNTVYRCVLARIFDKAALKSL